MCLRVARLRDFGEDDCYRIGMSVREGVINAFHYEATKSAPKKRFTFASGPHARQNDHPRLDEGKGFDLKSVPDPLLRKICLAPPVVAYS